MHNTAAVTSHPYNLLQYLRSVGRENDDNDEPLHQEHREKHKTQHPALPEISHAAPLPERHTCVTAVAKIPERPGGLSPPSWYKDEAPVVAAATPSLRHSSRTPSPENAIGICLSCPELTR